MALFTEEGFMDIASVRSDGAYCCVEADNSGIYTLGIGCARLGFER